jgi:hypothetical protein
VSDQENIKPDEETDVEAHKKSKLMRGEGEAQEENTEEDDVELHGKSRKLL